MAKGAFSPLLSSIRFLLAACTVLSVGACGDDEPSPDFNALSIGVFVSQDPNFSVIADAVELTTWKDSLDQNGPYTMLLPSDKALSEENIESVNDLSADEWQRLLDYHIVPGALSSDQLIGTVQESLLPGYYWLVNKNENEIDINGETKMLSGDIDLKNGVVHILEGLLEPQALNVTFMAQNRGFNIFVKGLLQSGLDQFLEDREQHFTLFAPTDEAFEMYFQANEISEEDWLGFSRLEDFMRYFVLDESLDSAQLAAGPRISLTGDTLYISNQEGEIWLNGNGSLQEKDIQGGNGLIHGLDHVITAPDQSLATVVSESTQGNGYAEFKAALIYAQLLSALEENVPLTIFAPDNEAFKDWYEKLGVAGYYEVDETLLRETLLYHIAVGRYFTQDFQDGQLLSTWLNAAPLEIDSEAGSVNGASLDTNYINKIGTNGVIHGVQAVFEQPS
ncbi:fasciclin domain-containing protein [Echinicola soli]|uniref:Fasciclin domain-containing protein n=1 Tax=Echinicola soli TaxID=2591634 RepID=A0A514CEG8_9BACT|nr:fasciclin domain-containing protein [Echinicola soli]QDH78218.1 fasciclin domain-containing protein [Echinicola soli]